MSRLRVETLLSADHEGLATELTAVRPEKAVKKLKRRAWRKSLAVGAATLLGALIAAAQFPALAQVPPDVLGRWLVEGVSSAALLVVGLVLVAAGLSLPDT